MFTDVGDAGSLLLLGFPLVVMSGDCLSRCMGCSAWRLPSFGSTGSRQRASAGKVLAQQLRLTPESVWAPAAVPHGLISRCSRAPECQLGSCGLGVQLLGDVWSLPGSGMGSACPALHAGPLPTVLPGEPWITSFNLSWKQNTFKSG